MTSKEKVLQESPTAMAWYPWFDSSKFFIVIPPINTECDIAYGNKLSDVFSTESEAWDDAASRLEAAHGK